MSWENDAQKEFWEQFADVWVTHQADLDGLMMPVLQGVFDRAGLKPGQHVLDIGCGTGTSTLRAAEIVRSTGHVDGVDISAAMLSRAQLNAKNVSNVCFEAVDAADFPFEVKKYDAVISRFGVMFFADPVRAFANIRKGMKSGATLTMASWSFLDANPWFQIPMYAAKQRLGAPPQLDPDGPGPLAFRDIDRVCGILTAAGFDAASGEAVALDLTPPGDVSRVAEHAALIGPASRTMEYFGGTEADFAAIAQDVAAGFADYGTPDGVRVPAEINFFTATTV